MYNLTWGLVLVFFFLGFLLFLLKQRQRYFEYHPQSWRMVVWGVILLVLAGGANLLFILYQTTSAFNAGLNQIISGLEIFGYVTGGGLVLAGFLKWCSSLLEAKKNATRRLRQLACLNSLLSVINHRQEPDQILKGSLANLLNIMGYKMGVIFKPTFNSSEMTVTAHAGVPVKNLHALFDLYSKNMWYKESIKSKEITTTTDTKSLPEYGILFSDQEQIRSFACVPIKFCGRLLGLMGLYDSRPDRFSYQEIQFLTTFGEILGLSAKQTLTSNRNKKRRDYISAIENMFKIKEGAGTLEEAFPKISAEFKKIIDFDHISLALRMGTGKDVRRISIGSSGGVLVDQRVVLSGEGSALGQVISSGEMRLDRQIDLDQNSSEDPLSKACGIKSRIILPLWCGESVYGALSLGHPESDFYSVNDAKWLRPFTLGLSHLVLEQVLKEKLNRKQFLSRSLCEFEQKLVYEEDLRNLIEDMVASLTQDLPKSFARVSLLNKQQGQLIPCATHQIRSEGIDLNKQDRFSLDDLPWHRLTLEAKRPMLINQDDPESLMSRKEAQLILDEKMNSALLVPLILDDEAVGVISLGEMRSWERQPLSEEEVSFVTHKANQICLALKKGLLHRSNKQLKERLKSLESHKEEDYNQTQTRLWLSDLSYQINNPLTSIRGSAELLRLSQPNLSADSLKYIRNIEKGVDRIHQSLEEFSISSSKEKESELNQLIQAE
jgi:transcriptional regulator with GAF, ATPase, and Fis domain